MNEIRERAKKVLFKILKDWNERCWDTVDSAAINIVEVALKAERKLLLKELAQKKE